MIFKDTPDQNASRGSSFIRLSLRKPKEWKVALTTSVSSPAIIPPKIQLWDEVQGDILLDTSRDCVRSKSASYVRNDILCPNRTNGKAGRTHSDKPVGKSPACGRSGGYQSRSKSLSAREARLVKPDEYERPRTPVMVARRISLTKEDSVHSITKPTPLVNGITTHHRKQNSDSSSASGPRKVKRNVSFGRVDTIDDSSSLSSGFSLRRAREREGESPRYTSSPRIVITEVLDSADDSESKAESRISHTKQKSQSGIPVLIRQRDSSNKDRKIVSNENKVNHSINKVEKSGRKSRIEQFISDNPGGQRAKESKSRFTVVRVPDNNEPPGLVQRPLKTKPSVHHHSCDRGNCPFDKYLSCDTSAKKLTSIKGSFPDKRGKGLNYSGNSMVKDKDVIRREKKGEDSKRRERSKLRKNRVPSRSREEAMSSSSSSDSEEWKKPRTPPRWRRSHQTKGDRLVGVNGQCVRTPQEAEERLRLGPDTVLLHLQRHGVSQSLPRHRLEEPGGDATMGSNMSRHSGKGLTGRRSQSSGNLCNGKASTGTPSVARFFSPCGRGNDSVGPRDRYKFCGSLPNHLDAKDPALDEVSEAENQYRNNNNVLVNSGNKSDRDVVLRLQPLVPKGISTKSFGGNSVHLDQGYGSEKSPEDDAPPELPPATTVNQLTCPVHHPGSKPAYPFLHKNSTFTVTLVKGTRGLGLSVTGGVDTEEPWPGLIRIKRLFPHQPAWQSGQLAPGDFLLVVNNTSLVGLTNYEALEVLRMTPTEVVLTVCRPPPELQVLSAPPPADTAPAPPRRDNPPSSNTSSLLMPLKRMESFGEFEVTLKKVNGSLGFTLRKEDESVLGHYVRALVREPALSDGRIKPGDKIVAVNGVDLSPMSHEEAVVFLRQCGQEVHLRLFRDPAQTPVQALSPTEHHRTFKPILRKEAQDMLSDLAVKKSMSPNESSGSSTLSKEGRTSSPRKRRLTKTPSPDLGKDKPDNHLSWSTDILDRISPGGDGDRPRRPDSLNFAAEWKPHFQFSAVSKTEESLNNLDSLDCGNSSPLGVDSDLGVGPLPSEPVSMPPLMSSTSDTTIGFSYRNPAYRSANPAPTKSKSSLSEDLPENRCSDNDLTVGANSEDNVEGTKGLLKWKGVVFTPEDGTETVTSPEDSISQITEVDNSNNQVLVVELNRGWNSRLGFSLQQSGRNTLIRAIHPDSVASRDGRLKVGDQLIMVNDESIEGMSTTEVINLLRKIRGSICITVWRKTT